MNAVQSGTGRFVVVPRATYRAEREPLRLPLPVQFAAEEARATLGGAFADLDQSQRTTGPDGFDGQATAGPFVSLNRPNDAPGRLDERMPDRDAEPIEGDPAFALGLHAATVGDGDPLSLRSLVGLRALPPGHYRNVTVPIWRGNPYPIVPPRHTGERPRTHWTDVDLGQTGGGRTLVDVTATCWHAHDTDAPGDLTPVRDWWGLPVTSTATVAFEPGAGTDDDSTADGADDRDLVVRGGPRDR